MLDDMPDQPPRTRRRKRNGLLLAGAVGALMAAIGFVVFVESLARREPAAASHADGIVVLTGGAERIADAIDLLERGVAKRLLITGVNERISSDEFLKQWPGTRRLFSCCIDLDYRALNTIGNARQTRDRARDNGFHSLLVVTSSYHMPRALAEIGHALPDVGLIAHPVVSEGFDSARWWRDPATARLLIVEYLKYIVALARIHALGGAAMADASMTSREAALRNP